jgi:quercetin dioxygenase-like cupin family protein
VSFAGEEIDNPAMGARIRFRTVAAASNGELLEIDFFLRPGGVIATDHLHPHQEERFEVISGSVVGQLAGLPRAFGRGEESIAAPGVPHAWRNGSDVEQVHLRVQFRPALRTEDFFDTVFALGRAGRADAAGVPRLPERLALLATFSHEFRPARMPAPLHAALARLLAPWARRRMRRWTRGCQPDPSACHRPTDRPRNRPTEGERNDRTRHGVRHRPRG